MKKLAVIATLLIAFVFAIPSYAQQAIVYKSYQDFVDKKGENYDSFHKYYVNINRPSYVFMKGGEKVIINGEDIWGFVIGDAFFRIAKDKAAVRLMSMGKILYFENGFAHLDMLRKDRTTAEVKAGEMYYVAQDLQSDIIELAIRDYVKQRGEMNELVKANPHYRVLFDCMIEKRFTLEGIRKCVETFEAKK